MSNRASPRHKQVARLIVSGHSQAEIARLMGTHKSTICRMMRTPEVLQEVERLQGIADSNVTASVPGIPEKIREKAHQAVNVLTEILEDERSDPEILKIKSNIALELLSRAGYGPIKQVNVKQASISTHLTTEEIEKIKERARELSKQSIYLDVQDSRTVDM